MPLFFGSRKQPIAPEDKPPNEGWTETAVCDFPFILADKLRASTSDRSLTKLPRRQDMPKDWIVYKTISFDEVVRGSYVKEYMTVSHRWETVEQPDPEGVQFEAIRAYVMTHPDVKYVLMECARARARAGPLVCVERRAASFSIARSPRSPAASCAQLLVLLAGRKNARAEGRVPHAAEGHEHALHGHERAHPRRPIVHVALLGIPAPGTHHDVCLV
jgi:hypothetical protein